MLSVSLCQSFSRWVACPGYTQPLTLWLTAIWLHPTCWISGRKRMDGPSIAEVTVISSTLQRNSKSVLTLMNIFVTGYITCSPMKKTQFYASVTQNQNHYLYTELCSLQRCSNSHYNTVKLEVILVNWLKSLPFKQPAQPTVFKKCNCQPN